LVIGELIIFFFIGDWNLVYWLFLCLPEHFVFAGHILVHKGLLEGALDRHEGPAASRPVHAGLLARKVAETQ
jgi:hypothetical protein